MHNSDQSSSPRAIEVLSLRASMGRIAFLAVDMATFNVAAYCSVNDVPAAMRSCSYFPIPNSFMLLSEIRKGPNRLTQQA